MNESFVTLSIYSGETYGPKETLLLEESRAGAFACGVCNIGEHGTAAVIAASTAFTAAI